MKIAIFISKLPLFNTKSNLCNVWPEVHTEQFFTRRNGPFPCVMNMVTPWHKNSCQMAHEIYNLAEPFLLIILLYILFVRSMLRGTEELQRSTSI